MYNRLIFFVEKNNINRNPKWFQGNKINCDILIEHLMKVYKRSMDMGQMQEDYSLI